MEIIKEEEFLNLDPINKIKKIRKILEGTAKLDKNYEEKIREKNYNHIPRID